MRAGLVERTAGGRKVDVNIKCGQYRDSFPSILQPRMPRPPITNKGRLRNEPDKFVVFTSGTEAENHTIPSDY